MKSYLGKTIVVVGFIILVLGVDLRAQSVTKVVADIPFAFYVGGEKHSEGRYEFAAANRNALPGALVIRSLTGPVRESQLVPALTADASAPAGAISVVFNRYGSTHYLSRVELGGGNIALRLITTPAERVARKQHERPAQIAVGPRAAKGR